MREFCVNNTHPGIILVMVHFQSFEQEIKGFIVCSFTSSWHRLGTEKKRKSPRRHDVSKQTEQTKETICGKKCNSDILNSCNIFHVV